MQDEKLSPKFWEMWAKHIGPERLKAVHPDWYDGAGERIGAQWLALIAEAERLKDSDRARRRHAISRAARFPSSASSRASTPS